MKNFNQFINESKDEDLEKLFIELCHINDLEIRFNFIETVSKSWTYALIYAYDNDIIF